MTKKFRELELRIRRHMRNERELKYLILNAGLDVDECAYLEGVIKGE